MDKMRNTIDIGDKVAEKGMAIAGIVVGFSALSFCLFAYNWFTCLFSCIGLVLSAISCASRKKNNIIALISIFCSGAALIIGIIVSPEVLTSNFLAYNIRIIIAWTREIGGELQAILRQYLLVVF